MAVAVATALRPTCKRVVLVRRIDDGLPWSWPDGEPIEVLAEPDDAPVHPLRGIALALRAAHTELVAIAPCDVPRVSARTWSALVACAPSAADPLIAVLPAAWAGRAAALAEAGAPAWRLVEGVRRIEVPAEELRDVDDPRSLAPGPIRRLLDRVPVVDPVARERIALGERTRLANRGMVDPAEGRWS
jgi:molybdopterin-guanine dinucleotide biosynthesis protein A